MGRKKIKTANDKETQSSNIPCNPEQKCKLNCKIIFPNSAIQPFKPVPKW